jgi:hypothetical protein
MKIPKDGSKWGGSDRTTFRVLHTIELEGNLWVHYIRENTEEVSREYSCYLESFLQRFTEMPE